MKDNVDLEQQENELTEAIKNAENDVELSKHLEKLKKNKSFKDLFEGYLFGECISEAVKSRAEAFGKQAEYEYYDNLINCLGTLQTLLDRVDRSGKEAEAFLDNAEEVLATIRAERVGL